MTSPNSDPNLNRPGFLEQQNDKRGPGFLLAAGAVGATVVIGLGAAAWTLIPRGGASDTVPGDAEVAALVTTTSTVEGPDTEASALEGIITGEPNESTTTAATAAVAETTTVTSRTTEATTEKKPTTAPSTAATTSTVSEPTASITTTTTVSTTTTTAEPTTTTTEAESYSCTVSGEVNEPFITARVRGISSSLAGLAFKWDVWKRGGPRYDTDEGVTGFDYVNWGGQHIGQPTDILFTIGFDTDRDGDIDTEDYNCPPFVAKGFVGTVTGEGGEDLAFTTIIDELPLKEDYALVN